MLPLLLLVGGLQMNPVKHQSANRFVYNSGFFLATNVYPDFGENVDAEAIKCRLEVFHAKTLPRKDGSVSGKTNILVSV